MRAKKATKELMEETIAKRWIVEYDRRPIDKQPLFGFKLAYNDEFTLIQEFNRSYFRLDSYCVFRNESVKMFSIYDEEDYFFSEVVRFEKIKPVSKPARKISLESWRSVLESADKLFPLVVIEETNRRDVYHVGKVDAFKRNTFILNEIDPHAEWEKKRTHKYENLTTVKFGGRYESVLASVNSKRSELAKSVR